jgi:DDE superfamily endonuclease
MDTCSGCGDDTSGVSHQCDKCGRKNHVFCGIPIEEGQGGCVRCHECSTKPATSAVPSASPIIAAFTRTRAVPTTVTPELHQATIDTTEAVGSVLHQAQAETASESKNKRKREPQIVSMRTDRARIVKWMEEMSALGHTDFKIKAIKQFPTIFKSNYKANWQKASDWFSKRIEIQGSSLNSITRNQDGAVRRVRFKASAGRGRKRAPWVVWLHDLLVVEFARLRSLGVKITNSLLIEAAISLLERSTGEFNRHSRDGGTLLVNKLTTRWILSFCERHNVVPRKVCGKLSISPEKQASIERAVAYHLGNLKRRFDDGSLHDDMVFNMDETHFVINMDDGKTLDFKGAETVKYNDVVSGGEGMTLVVKLRGGFGACIETPMIVFQNQKCSYPIRSLPDDVPGVTYRSGPCGWMDRRVFVEWLKENRCVKRDPYDREQYIFMDNASGHKPVDGVDAVLAEKRVSIEFLPSNSTDLCQPADATIIQKLKQAWRNEWEREKLRLATSHAFSNVPNKGGEWSGKLLQPGKTYFLKLAAKCCRIVSDMRDDEQLNLVRKSMIRCGLNKNLNGVWEERQLFPHLQAIVEKHRVHFEGKPPLDVDEAVV